MAFWERIASRLAVRKQREIKPVVLVAVVIVTVCYPVLVDEFLVDREKLTQVRRAKPHEYYVRRQLKYQLHLLVAAAVAKIAKLKRGVSALLLS